MGTPPLRRTSAAALPRLPKYRGNVRDLMAPGSGVPPVLAHRAHKNGHAVARHPHVLARRALKLCSFWAQEVGVLAGRAQSEAAPPPAPEQAKQN